MLEVVEAVADAELEGAFTWLVGLLGLVLVGVGPGLWLLTDAGLLVLGVVLLVAPSVLLAAAELA